MSEVIFTCTSWSFLLVPLRLLLGKPLFLLLLLLKDLQRLASAYRESKSYRSGMSRLHNVLLKVLKESEYIVNLTKKF